MKEMRHIVFHGNHFIEFYVALPQAAQEKYDYTLVVVRQAERIPKKFFKKVAGTKKLYEIRVEADSNIYRKFCCLDGHKVVVLFNSFHKKSQKTPSRHISKALKLLKEYYAK